MARINDGILKDWLDGNVVKATEYKQEREILRIAINDNYDRLVQKYTKLEVDALLASLQTEVDAAEGRITSLEGRTTDVEGRVTSLELEDSSNKTRLGTLESQSSSLDGRMDTAETNIINRYTKEETRVQIGILAGGSGFIDGGAFTDVYSSQFEMIDGGEF